MNFYNNFTYNLDNCSIIQKCIDNGYTKPLYTIIDHILKIENNDMYREVIMTDLA